VVKWRDRSYLVGTKQHPFHLWIRTRRTWNYSPPSGFIYNLDRCGVKIEFEEMTVAIIVLKQIINNKVLQY
jgi:hypothetical protein